MWLIVGRTDVVARKSSWKTSGSVTLLFEKVLFSKLILKFSLSIKSAPIMTGKFGTSATRKLVSTRFQNFNTQMPRTQII